MIDVFNRLTDQQLADCRLFENLIILHYEKFKFFYSIIEDICLSTVQKIYCQEDETKLSIFINFKTKKDTKSFKKLFENYTDCVEFNILIQEEKNNLNISIEDKNCGEGE